MSKRRFRRHGRQKRNDGRGQSGTEATDRLERAIAAIADGDYERGRRLLVQLLNSNPRHKSARAWMQLAVDEVEESHNRLSSQLFIEPDDTWEYLLSYDFPQLQRVTEETRQEFALAAALRSRRLPLDNEVWYRGDEPLAAILGTQYELAVDREAMTRELTGAIRPYNVRYATSPVLPSQRAELWPRLAAITDLSLAARKVFIRALQSVQLRAGLVEYDPGCFLADKKKSAPEVEEALIELAEAGFVDLEPSRADLLGILSVKELKQFAFDHRMDTKGPKHRLIERVISRADQDSVEELLNEFLRSDTQYIRPLVDNLRLLKKHVWAEVRLVEMYIDWLSCLYRLERRGQYKTPEFDLESDSEGVGPRLFNVTIEHVDPSPRQPRLSTVERHLVRGIWDDHCDEIVKELVEDYAWDAKWYMKDALLEYLPAHVIEAFQGACEEEETRSWYNLLMYYGEMRLEQMKVCFPESRLLTCAGCGRDFQESSIRCKQAERVGRKIHFCSDCYDRILYRSDALVQPSPPKAEMLEALADLASALGSVPLAAFVLRPDLSGMSDEKQVAVGQALLGMAYYEHYVEAFGSWLNALVKAGLLEGNVIPARLGTRCVAADGHECYSLAEKAIDDWLSQHGIVHEKEPGYPYHHPLNTTGLRADWRVQDTYIEYAGLMDEPEYAARMEAKQELATELGLELIVLEEEDLFTLSQKLGHLIEE